MSPGAGAALLVLVALGCGGAEPAPAPAPAPVVAAPAPSPLARLDQDGPFTEQLAPGLVVSALVPPEIPPGPSDPAFSRPPPDEVATTDRRLFVVTIDPSQFDLRYHSVLDPGAGTGPLDAGEWAAREDLVVAWNPGMFEPDRRATGHTRAGGLTTQPAIRRNGLYRSWFVVTPGAPAAMLDQVPPKGQGTYAGFDELPAPFRDRLAGAGLVVQSLPILRDGAPAYPARKNQWSELCYGVDRQGRVVVVFSRHPYEMRELGARIAALGLDIDGLLHGEGGPEASLVIRLGGETWARMGSYETGFMDDGNQRLWPLPSILGAAPR